MSFKFSKVLLLTLLAFNIFELKLQNKTDGNNIMYQSMIERKKKEMVIEKMKINCMQIVNKNRKHSMVFYFSIKNCQPCFEMCLDMLNRTILKRNIYVISFFDNKNMQIFFQNKYSNLEILEGTILGCKVIDFIDLNTPYFFEVDDSGNVCNAFVPDKNYPDLLKMYLDYHSFD